MSQQRPDPEDRRDWRRAVTAVAEAIRSGRLGTGETADLRRLDPEDPGSAAYWHALARLVEPRDSGPAGEGDARLRWERQWAVILAGMARLPHQAGRSLGRSLAGSGFHELRLRRLLRADGARLWDELRAAIQFLANRWDGVDWSEVAELILADPAFYPDWAQRVRRRVARAYFSHQGVETDKDAKEP